MNEAWIPVFFAAVIITGVVGGTVIQMVLKELVPILGRIAEGRSGVSLADPDQRRTLVALERRLEEVESDRHRLQEEAKFLHQLLERDGDRSSLHRGASGPGARSALLYGSHSPDDRGELREEVAGLTRSFLANG